MQTNLVVFLIFFVSLHSLYYSVNVFQRDETIRLFLRHVHKYVMEQNVFFCRAEAAMYSNRDGATSYLSRTRRRLSTYIRLSYLTGLLIALRFLAAYE